MNGRDLIAERRSALREQAPWLQAPAGQLVRRVRLEPLRQALRARNAQGRYPPGLRATITHLLLRAVAQAVEERPDFNAFLLLTGRTSNNPKVVIRLPLDAEGHTAFTSLADAAGCPFDQLVVTSTSLAIEDQQNGIRRAEKAVRFWQNRPLLARVLGTTVVTPLTLAVRSSPDLQKFFAGLVRKPHATFVMANIGVLGPFHAWASLFSPAKASVVVGGPSFELLRSEAGVRPEKTFPVSVVYDLRCFQPFQAAELLAAICEALADPAKLMQDPPATSGSGTGADRG